VHEEALHRYEKIWYGGGGGKSCEALKVYVVPTGGGILIKIGG
jgi:hypothetical protein